MFFKRKPVALTENEAPEIAWDTKTVDYFVKEKGFDVQIINVTRGRGFGTTRPLEEIMYEGRAILEPIAPDEYEISGVITYPKLILLKVSTDGKAGTDFGFWPSTMALTEGFRMVVRAYCRLC